MPGCGGGEAGKVGNEKGINRFSANVFSLFLFNLLILQREEGRGRGARGREKREKRQRE